jgi:N-acetyl-anhydromuramoyl-L-alanine amidase
LVFLILIPDAPMTEAMPHFEVDAASGLMSGARQVASPNQDARPSGTRIDLIVVHGISLPPGEFEGQWIEQLFTNQLPRDAHPYFEQIAQVRVSAHLLVRRNGEVVQFVGFNERAWHAGKSSYAGREACNDFSVGIELEGTDDVPYEPIQYRVLAACVVALCEAFPTLSSRRIVGHSDIAPGRKSDPGASFDWGLARALMESSKNQGDNP